MQNLLAQVTRETLPTVLTTAEDAELNAHFQSWNYGKDSQQPEILVELALIYCTQVLGYASLHEMEKARFCVARSQIHEPIGALHWTDVPIAGNDLDTCCNLVQVLYSRDMSLFWNLVKTSRLSPILHPLLQILVSSVREEMWKLLANAYRVISTKQANTMLGLDQDWLTEAEKRGWVVEGDFCTTARQPEVKKTTKQLDITTISEMIVRLEK
jgi:hypothetical protein